MGAIALAFLYRDRLDAAALEAWVSGAGAAGPLLFIGLYAAATVLFLPGLGAHPGGRCPVRTPLGDPLQPDRRDPGRGPGLPGRPLSGRGLGAGADARACSGAWSQGVEAEGWRFVAFTRLVPLFPFNLLNYALGLTRIPFLHYLIATLVFMLPGALAYTYLGFAGREAVAGGEGLIQKGLIALALLAAVAFLPRLVARLRQRPVHHHRGAQAPASTRRHGILVLDRAHDRGLRRRAGPHPGGPEPAPGGVCPAQLADPQSPLAAGPGASHRAGLPHRPPLGQGRGALLARRGFAQVQVVQGGMTAWLAQGWPVEDAHPQSTPAGANP